MTSLVRIFYDKNIYGSHMSKLEDFIEEKNECVLLSQFEISRLVRIEVP